MSVFVLVHGGWGGGGWQWRGVAAELRFRGHEVFTPTLTGLGDRSHLATVAAADLSLHIRDIEQMLYFEDLTDVVLVGWSYGGAVVDGVADLVPERLSRVVNLDGEVVREGQSLMDGWTEEARAEMHDMLEQGRKTGWLPAPTADDLADVLDDPQLRAWVGERERAQPFKTETELYPDNGGRRFQVEHIFLRCINDDWPEEANVTSLRTDDRWDFRELPLNHLGLLYNPGVVADALHDLTR
jgi:pimeloyl-ACP methyl ester carboxylesterase